MPHYNDSLLAPFTGDPSTFYTNCPYTGQACLREKCIASLLTQDGGNWLFTGCELQENAAKIGMYQTQLDTIITTLRDTSSMTSTGFNDIFNTLKDTSSVMSTSFNDIFGALIDTSSMILTGFNEAEQKIDTIITALTDTTSSMILIELDEIQQKVDTVTTDVVNKIQEHMDENRTDFNRVYDMQVLAKLMIEEKLNILIEYLHFQNELEEHIHNRHNHILQHDASDVDSDILGSKFIPTIQPALYLLQEWTTGTDVDGNGKIYGKDFKISNNDKSKPMMLKGIEALPDWKNPPNIPGSRITYAEYVAYVNWGGENHG
jgi:hypothetical protein